MAELTTIDNVNIQTTYGMILGPESMAELMKAPSLKAPTTVDYPDIDGSYADLVSPQLETRKMSLTFYDVGGVDPTNFINMLSLGVIHTIKVDIVGGVSFWESSFRLSRVVEREMIGNYGKLKIEVVDYDSFFVGYNYQYPAMTGRDYGFYMDGVPFYGYGITPIGDSLVNVRQMHDLKDPLEWTNKLIEGGKVDTLAIPHKEIRDLTLSLWGCWNRSERNAWRAFVKDLTRAGYRTIVADGKSMQGWYRSANIKQLYYRSGHVNMLFDVNFTIRTTTAIV